jgi:hypothetical protein
MQCKSYVTYTLDRLINQFTVSSRLHVDSRVGMVT